MRIKKSVLCLILASGPLYGAVQDYSLGIEKQSDEMSSLYFNKHLATFSDLGAVSFGVSLLLDGKDSNNTVGLGVGYQLPIFDKNDNLTMDIGLNQYLSNESGLPSSQIKLGVSKGFLLTETSEARLGMGFYYNLLDDEELIKSGLEDLVRDDTGIYLSLSWAFSEGGHSPSIVSEVISPKKDNATLYISEFDVDSSYFRKTKKIAEKTKFDRIHLTAYFSCSGLDEYNEWLSLRRINRTLRAMEAEGIEVGGFDYSIFPSCVFPEDIRVEVTHSES